MLFFGTSSAQQYHSLIQENAYWQSLYAQPGNIHLYSSGQHFFFQGDTVINNKTYSILYYHPFIINYNPRSFTVDSTQVFRFAFFREDSSTKRAYIIPNHNGSREELFFDFSWTVGDTVPPCYINNTSTPKVT